MGAVLQRMGARQWRGGEDMSELPTTEPQADHYKQWPLKKLQDEYYRLSLKVSVLKLRESTAIAAQEEVEELARLFNKFLQRTEND